MRELMVSMEHITKSFPGVKALDDVRFELRAGEVMALLGENGAGKSTLVKILSGVYARDGGRMEILGKEYGDLTPKQAQTLGVAIIHQELNMCRHLSVAENIFLGREKTKGLALSNKQMDSEARQILDDLKIDLDPRTVVGELPVSKQQMVEIAKALSTDAKILIMDEPTSSLTSKEIEDLFRIIHELKIKGCGIVYISHRLEELEHIVDRVTIMRDGQHIACMPFQDVTLDTIITHMVGREIKEKFPRVAMEPGETILEVDHMVAGKSVKDVSFKLRQGEILGFAGLMGAGRTELMRAIFGVDPVESGTVKLHGNAVVIRTPADAIKAGIACVPEDRKKEGLCVNLPLRENVGLANLDHLTGRFGFINRKQESRLTAKAIQDLRIKASSQMMEAKNLSGGNQQKVVVGKWLVRDAQMILFDEPTRGIDVAAKVEIYNLMNQLKEKGIGVLFVSSEMPEIMGMSDRVIVMCDGRVTGEFLREEATQDLIMTCATQFEAKEGARKDAV